MLHNETPVSPKVFHYETKSGGLLDRSGLGLYNMGVAWIYSWRVFDAQLFLLWFVSYLLT